MQSLVAFALTVNALLMLPLACAASLGPCLSLWLLSGLMGWPVKALWLSNVKCG